MTIIKKVKKIIENFYSDSLTCYRYVFNTEIDLTINFFSRLEKITCHWLSYITCKYIVLIYLSDFSTCFSTYFLVVCQVSYIF